MPHETETEMPTSLTYGIEMECYVPRSIGQSGVARDLRALGINAVVAGYGGRDYSVWQVKTDGSLHAAPRDYTGIEVVAPVLTWGDPESERQVRIVSEYLTGIGAKVNASCGGHVHLSVGHLTAGQLANLVETYYRNIREIGSALIAPHRANGTGYAQIGSLDRIVAVCNEMRTTDNPRHVQRTGSHGSVINPDWYGQRGTLEFRHRDATVNHYKWMGWVGFLVALVRHAEADGEVTYWADADLMLAEMVERGHLTTTLRDWALRRVPAIRNNPAAALQESRSQARAQVSRLLSLQGVRA